MNEPSVFNGPEVSMQKDALSLAGIEHREWHNLYGMYMQRATADGLLQRNPKRDKRPFVLSRSFYAGSQRWGAIWTGDNACKWDHLVASIPMLLTLGLCGITFSGADVGGFLGKGGGYGDPDAELFTRWFEAGAYTPFFRGHAHHDSARREPWTFGDEAVAMLREVAKERYQLVAYWYTLFHKAEATGAPTMRPLWVHYPADAATWDAADQWLVGRDLFVHPVTAQGASSAEVYLPGTEAWFGVRDGARLPPGKHSVSAPLGTIPVFQRAGSVLPRQMRLRRAASLMGQDPFTLVVAPDSAGFAEGELYLDAGDGYEYKTGAYALRRFTFSEGTTLASSALHASEAFAPPNRLERLEILGVRTPARVVLTYEGVTRDLEASWCEATGRTVVRKPDVPIAADWTIALFP
jgi:alpha 1,3-glucosidase